MTAADLFGKPDARLIKSYKAKHGGQKKGKGKKLSLATKRREVPRRRVSWTTATQIRGMITTLRTMG